MDYPCAPFSHAEKKKDHYYAVIVLRVNGSKTVKVEILAFALVT